jgi:hypothetical protein
MLQGIDFGDFMLEFQKVVLEKVDASILLALALVVLGQRSIVFAPDDIDLLDHLVKTLIKLENLILDMLDCSLANLNTLLIG